MNLKIGLCLLLTAGLLLSSCAAGTGDENSNEFRVIAYVTDAVVVEAIDYQKLTHVNFSFLIPNSDGTFQPLRNPWKVEKLIDLAHQNDVQVLISVGGWGWSNQFEEIAADPALRKIFIDNLVAIVETFGFDGVDMDWEYPEPGVSAENFLALILELHAALPDESLLTTAVIDYGDVHGLGMLKETFEYFDFVNVMTYSGKEHGSMKQYESGLAYWLGRGLPRGKIVLGVPFYSEPSGVPFHKLVRADESAAEVDEFDYFGAVEQYNGIPTIQEKTRIAMDEAGGIMFWTLEHDAQGEFSLLSAIDAVVRGE